MKWAVVIVTGIVVVVAESGRHRGMDPRIDAEHFFGTHRRVSCEMSLYDQRNVLFDENSPNTIPIEQLNDDYCDCAESGVDETGSNACDRGRFYCRSRFATTKHIHSSKVNDGYCDCCDCSDEFESIAESHPVHPQDNCYSRFSTWLSDQLSLIRSILERKSAALREVQRRGTERELENVQQQAVIQKFQEKLKYLKHLALKLIRARYEAIQSAVRNGTEPEIYNSITIFELFYPRLQEAERGVRAARSMQQDNQLEELQDPIVVHFRMKDVSQRVQQRSVLVNRFRSVDVGQSCVGRFAGGNYSDDRSFAARFEGGDECEASGRKSAVVRIRCGPEDAITGVEKLNDCEYEVDMESYMLCSSPFLTEQYIANLNKLYS